MTTTTAASPPPPPASPGDLWFDTGNGNCRNECSGAVTWPSGAGWTGTHATAATGRWPDGSAALLLTADGTGVSGWYGSSPSQYASAGALILAAAEAFVPAVLDGAGHSLGEVALSLAWYDDMDTLIEPVTMGSTAPVPVGGTASITVTGTAPAGTASFQVQAGDGEDSAAGTQMLVQRIRASTWTAYQFGAGASANAEVVVLTETPARPGTPSGQCLIYYKDGILYALGPSGVPVAIATT